ncbi:OadG family protein [Spirochaeta cellobiosiphila]|uniref:OadG family protein n=1 Tax=Spirochaeta cellobiosiphila TaxID=504483 RepID=UPI0004010E7E|nr:OadG family protein [Spirochaeta cellobiosiphila]
MLSINLGLTLTVVGMTTVFSFLVLLVLIMSVSSTIIQRFFPEKTNLDINEKKTNDKKVKIALAIAVSKAKEEGLIS